MKHVNNKLLLSAAIAALLAGCDSGGISIEPETVDNSVDNSVSGGTPTEENNPCASYDKSGQVMQGSFDGANCTYSASFVDSGNALTQDLFIPALDNGGVHIFEGSLFVGKNYDDDATMASAGITEGGDGAKLTIEAGSTIAFPDSTKFMVINRGSQLFAVGTAEAPITFTSTSDAVDNAVAFDAVQQWGGMVINGFGITNKCSYDASLNTSECHVLAEGAAGKDQSNYGGDNNSDSSGQLEYVRVKHTGAEVANGDELNGITFSAVGSDTIVKNLQVYSTYDDGIEMFGGAVSFENYLAMYVRDDSIDIDEGWSGSITNALVIQAETDGNHCIESDGIGSYDDKDAATIDAMIAAGINSRPVIDGLTCIISANGADTATHDPGAGWRFREAIFPKITNSMVVASFNADTTGVDGSNYCLRVEDPETLAEAEVGTELQIESNIFACEDRTKGGPVGAQTLEEWAVANNNVFADITGAVDPTAMNATQLQILEGTPSVFSIAAENMMVNDAPIAISPISRAYFGALSQGDLDWTQGWTYGLHDGETLWFAN